MQGDPGDLFYVIKEGEASVYQVWIGWNEGCGMYPAACLPAALLACGAVMCVNLGGALLCWTKHPSRCCS